MKYLAIALLAAWIAACGQPPAPPAQVQLDIFSGRPAPTWALSAADTRALRDRVATLPAANQSMPEGHLGYRGFIVTLPHTTNALTSTVLVYHDAIAYERDGEPRLLRDVDRRIERLLIASAKDYLDAETYAALVSQAASE